MRPPVFNPGWSAEVRAIFAHDMQEMWDQRIAPHIWNQYHNQLDIYLTFASGDSIDVLDVGCAQGTLALLLAEKGHRVTAVDLRREFLDYAAARHSHGEIRFLQANVLEEEIPGYYDLVFANQIVEHLVYPGRLLERLRKKLRPGGRLVVTTPNVDYLRNSLPTFNELGDPGKFEHMQFTADGDGHFFAYRQEELVELFRAAGFMEVEARFFESPAISGHMKMRHLHGILPVSALRVVDMVITGVPWISRRLSHQLLVTGVAKEDRCW